MTSSTSNPGIPPEVSPRAAAIARKLFSPIESFLHIEAASGIVLLVAAALAVAVANSPWAEAYHRVVEAPVGFRIGSLAAEYPLHFWINDGLMTIFFFVVGLEIRRETHDGELSNLRRAALPAFAALGGMVAPALVFLAIASADPAARRGWGVPMATDIAFAVGVLTLLGRRVPHALRVLLLALAIIDDIGSIIVIALFYSSGIATSGLLIAGVGGLAIIAFQRLGVRKPILYIVPGFVVWLGMLKSGIHPTIAGVIVGLMTPARRWFGPNDLARTARGAATHIEREMRDGHVGADALSHETDKLEIARREVVPPAVRLQTLLHPWVAFGIMPIFAVANSGVTVTSLGSIEWKLASGVTLGLVVGKPLGIVLVTALAIRFGVTVPRGIGKRELLVLGVVAGIGFTMALFVASLAFGPGKQLESAKLAILAASAIAIVLGLGLGRVLLDVREAPDEASSAADAEARDDA